MGTHTDRQLERGQRNRPSVADLGVSEDMAERQKQLDRQRIGTKGVVDIFLREVKFNDQEKIDESESIPQRCFHRSRTKVGGSKTIRYRRSLNHKRCRLGIGWWCVSGCGGDACLCGVCCWHDC